MTVALLYTGGTVGHRPSARAGSSEARGLVSFLALLRHRLPPSYWPERMVADAVSIRMSENRIPRDWAEMACAVDRQIRGGVEGVVLAHGTDTLIYSACALAELLRGVPIPVAITGSRLPLCEAETDAVQNIAHAFRIARESGRPGIWIVFAGSGNRPSLVLEPQNARKEAGRHDCFQPVAGLAAGQVMGNVSEGAFLRVRWFQEEKSFGIPYRPHFDVRSDVVLFKLYPGFRPGWIGMAVRRGVRAILLEGYGSGTACAEGGRWGLTGAVRAAVRRGVEVRVLSQHGGIPERRYASTRLLLGAGAQLAVYRTAEAELARWMCGLDGTGRKGYYTGRVRRLDERTGRRRSVSVGF